MAQRALSAIFIFIRPFLLFAFCNNAAMQQCSNVKRAFLLTRFLSVEQRVAAEALSPLSGTCRMFKAQKGNRITFALLRQMWN